MCKWDSHLKLAYELIYVSVQGMHCMLLLLLFIFPLIVLIQLLTVPILLSQVFCATIGHDYECNKVFVTICMEMLFIRCQLKTLQRKHVSKY